MVEYLGYNKLFDQITKLKEIIKHNADEITKLYDVTISQKNEIDELKRDVKALKEQLLEIMNLGPTITQKKFWLDGLINTIQTDIAKKFAIKKEILFGKTKDLPPEFLARLKLK